MIEKGYLYRSEIFVFENAPKASIIRVEPAPLASRRESFFVAVELNFLFLPTAIPEGVVDVASVLELLVCHFGFTIVAVGK